MAPGESGGQSSPFPPLQAELARMKRSTLSSAIKDVDEIIDFLTSAREQVAGGANACHRPLRQATAYNSTETDSHKIGMAMMTLQNPVKTHLEAINNDLKEVNKAQKSFGKALDKVRSRLTPPLPE